MLIVSYDIANDKVRNKFSKFLRKFWRRLQYSVYEIKNSDRHIANIQTEIEGKFAKMFSKSDSILIVPISKASESSIVRYGYAVNEELEFIFV